MRIHHWLWAGRLGMIAAVILCGIPNLQGQLDFGKSAKFSPGFNGPVQNLELPPQVVAPEGEFTIFADFEKPIPEGRIIYLVNRTSRPIGVPIDGRLKLARASDDGTWTRAQSQDYSPRCFSGDFTQVVLPGQHLITIGYVPTQGTPGKVRYQLFDDPSGGTFSNEGPGLWNPKDVEDAMRAEAISKQLWSRGNRATDFSGDVSSPAVIEELENVLARLDLDGLVNSREAMAPEIEMLKSQLSKVAEDHPARKRLAEIEERPDKTLTADAFLQRCLEMLRASNSAAKGFGRPENRPWIVWNVLRELTSTMKSLAGLKEIFQLAESRLAIGGVPEKDAIGWLFYRNAQMAEFIPKSTLIAHLNSDSLHLSRACISQLAYLGDYQELAEQGNKADLPLKLRIVGDFCREPNPSGTGNRLRSLGYGTEQPKFMESCIKAAPWDTFLNIAPNEPFNLEPEVSNWFDEAYESFLAAAETGPFPAAIPDTRVGLLQYVEYLSANPSRRSIAQLRRTVALREHAPADEPPYEKRARHQVVHEAGVALRLDEYFR